VILIDNGRKRIRYLNSQVVDTRTPDFQCRPFREVFPGYEVELVTKSQQCDNSSCGVYCCLWAHLFLFYEEQDLDNIRCPDAIKFRLTVLYQLIIAYILLPRSFS
jgi:hypothetical protein